MLVNEVNLGFFIIPPFVPTDDFSLGWIGVDISWKMTSSLGKQSPLYQLAQSFFFFLVSV